MQLEFGFSEAPRRSGFPAKGIGIRRMRRPVDSRRNLILPGLQYRAIVTLFFELQLEANAAAQAFAIPCQIGLNLPKRSIVPQENLHATLHLVAQQEGIPESLRQRAREAISGVSGSSFDVTFDRLESFNLDPPRHALVLLCGQGLEISDHLASSNWGGVTAVRLQAYWKVIRAACHACLRHKVFRNSRDCAGILASEPIWADRKHSWYKRASASG